MNSIAAAAAEKSEKSREKSRLPLLHFTEQTIQRAMMIFYFQPLYNLTLRRFLSLSLDSRLESH